MKLRFAIPLAVFLALAGLLGYALLNFNPRDVPSPLIGKPAPAFRLASLHNPERSVSPEDLKGQVWMLNVWASWCVSCRVEHPLLVQISRSHSVPIIGLNYKEIRGDGGIDFHRVKPEEEAPLARERASQWLVQHGGDPYRMSAMDLDGRVGIDWGVYGVPETFIVDRKGVVRHKHTGPLNPDAWNKTIEPLIRRLEAEPA